MGKQKAGWRSRAIWAVTLRLSSLPEKESGYCSCMHLRGAWMFASPVHCGVAHSHGKCLPSLVPMWLALCTSCCPLLRLLIYGEYCSHMEHAQTTLNQLLASREDFRQKVEVTRHPDTLGIAGWPRPRDTNFPQHPFLVLWLLPHFAGRFPEYMSQTRTQPVSEAVEASTSPSQ